ncbi:retropepsin-like aspartic protease [Zunongwangia sp.]|uniref:retropepsin-like aspartic protease n=1 Tax=Zunongwangia sp. TaxID=1965325 RepID=UPI003AA8C6CD
MKIIKIFIYILTFIIVNSCAVSKAEKYLREGKTIQENYKIIVPFEIINGFIFIKPKIKNKDYNFILDTGASNAVSKELSKSLNLKVIDSEKIGDIYNRYKIIEYARIDTIKIGSVDFAGTIASINDFKSVPYYSSMKIDGIIGSNLMQHAIWDFDFEKKQITITDNESKLTVPKKTITNKLFIGFAGVPSIACKINGKKVWNFTVDTGYNGGIVIPFSEFEKQIKNGKISDFEKFKSRGVIGIYGQQKTMRQSYTGVIKEIQFGNKILKNEEVYSEQYLEKTFGLDFFKNYRVILNWDSKTIKLIENKEKSNNIKANA